jgi:RND family efflux transporter MFP subunit
LAAVVLAGVVLLGASPRSGQEQEVNAPAAPAAAATSTAPPVTVAVAQCTAAEAERVLPGRAFPLLEAALFARTTGYLKTRKVDIGDRVQEGQLLAEISAPDIDDQLALARANLAQARANLRLAEAGVKLAQVTLDRDLRAGPGGVSPLTLDQDYAQTATAKAQAEATRAAIQVSEVAVQRFKDLQHFQKLVAPFPGVITARHVDPGDLIPADSPGSTRELFHLMRTDVLRVLVNVPQVFATDIKVGQDASVSRREEPRKQHAGKVTRTADALDPNTQTLLTEIQVPNPENNLRPGMSLQVKFTFERRIPTVRVPAAAVVVMPTGGQRVAVLDERHRVRYRAVHLGREYEGEVEVLSGLEDGETVVVHPGADIPEGKAVEVVPPPK